MNELKTISKSIRMTETVQEFVNRQHGAGFNQKFENLCHRFMLEEYELDRRIKEKKALLLSLSARTRAVQDKLRSAENVGRLLECLDAELLELAFKCNSTAPDVSGAPG